jgi:hypothetical protein
VTDECGSSRDGNLHGPATTIITTACVHEHICGPVACCEECTAVMRRPGWCCKLCHADYLGDNLADEILKDHCCPLTVKIDVPAVTP